MRNRLLSHGLAAAGALVALVWTLPAQAAITANPSSVTVVPGLGTATVNVTLTFPPVAACALFSCFGNLVFTPALAPGITISPASPSFSYGLLQTSATTSFQVSAQATATRQTVVFTLSANGPNAGTGTFTVTVASFSAAASPNPVTLVQAGPTQNVTIATNADPGFASAVSYTFTGFPAGITFGPNQLSQFPYSPLTFPFAANGTVAPGTYSGSLVGSYFAGRSFPVTKTFPMQVIVVVPDVIGTFAPSVVSACAGGSPVPTNLTLIPINGFTGTPLVTLISLPPGISISPSNFLGVVRSMPPAQTIPISVRAAPGALGGQVSFTIYNDVPAVNKVISFTVAVPPPDYTPSVAPGVLNVNSGGPAGTFLASLVPTCMTAPVRADVQSATPGLTVTPGTSTFQPPGYAPVAFTVQADTTVKTGRYPVVFTFTSAVGVPRSVTVFVSVTNTLDFTLSVTSPVTIQAGGSGTATVTATGVGGFNGAVVVSVPSAVPGLPGVTLTPATLNLNTGVPQAINIQADLTTPRGSGTATLSATAPSLPGISHTASLTVNVTQAPDFSLQVAPPSSTIVAGQSSNVSASVSFLNGFTGPVTVTAPVVGNLVFAPSSLTFNASGSQTVSVAVKADSPSGTFGGNFTGNGPGVGTKTAPFAVTVTPRPPVITSITPPAVATGTRSTTLTLTGLNFQPGAVVTVRPSGQQPPGAAGPDVTVESTVVLSPTLAKVAVTVRADATPGPYLLDLTNPDGGTANKSAALIVSSSDSIGAPVGVTAAAIVYPLPGQLLSPDKPVYGKGVIATTGMGSIIGTWLFDGIPFDRFAVTASGGFPVELYSNVPIPASFVGSHALQLAIESPQILVTPEIQVIESMESQTRLRILAPDDGTVVGRTRPLMRWTLVPGGSGYEVELLNPDGRTRERLVRLAADSWIPSQKDLAELGPGIHLWRVRAVFPANVEGTWTSTRRLVILPGQVALALEAPGIDPRTNRGLLKWRGGAPGLLYRVDFFRPGELQPGFLALTARPEYVLPPGSPWGAPDVRVRVTAFGSDGLPRGVSGIIAIPRNAFRRDPSSELLLAQSASSVTATLPKNGETVSSATPQIGATWSGVVAKEDVALFIDSTDVTQVSEVTPSSVSYTSLVPLSPGTRSARLSLAGKVTTWSFTVPADAPGAPAPEQPAAAGGTGAPADQTAPAAGETAAPQPPPPAVRTEWVLTALGTVTLVRAQHQPDVDQGRLQVTGQVDLATADGAYDGKATADIVGRHDFTHPRDTVNESRNWLVKAGANQPGGFREEGTVGYAAPAFLDQAQIMTAGLARGGVTGKVATPWLSASYYQSFDPRPAGLIAGTFGPEQRIKAAALEAPGDPSRLSVRAIFLQSEDQPGFNSAGGKGKLWGGFGKYLLSPAFTIIAEGAHGEFTPNAGSAETERSGNSFRLGLLGSVGTFSYTLNALHTDANFVNPANRGFTPGGVADRTGGDVSLNKTFGTLIAGLQYHHVEGGNSSGSTLPKSKEDGGNLNLSIPILPWFTAAATGNVTKNTGDADTVHSTPAIDRTQKATNLTLTETAGGRFTISEGISYQELRDEINSLSDQTVKMAMITGSGMILPNLNLSVNLSGTRSEGAPTVGRNDQWLVSVQPALTIPRVFLTLTPRAAYTRSKADLTNTVSQNEQYQMMTQFAPTWINSLLAVQVAADWSRAQTTGQPTAPYTYRYVGTITLRWGANVKMGEPPPPPLPPPQTGQRIPLVPPLQIGARPTGVPVAAGAGLAAPAGGGL